MTAVSAVEAAPGGGLAAGQLSCYTAALARYLESAYEDSLTRVARSIRLAVRTDLPGGMIAFSHHGIPLSDLGGGRCLAYRGATAPAELLASLESELRVGFGVIAVTYTAAMDWSVADEEENAPHFVCLLAREHGRWLVDDPFAALLPSGQQEPFRGWIPTGQLIRAMTPPRRLGAEYRLRTQYVFGFAVPLPPDHEYSWLVRTPEVTGLVRPRPPGWITSHAGALDYLSDFWSGAAGHPDRVRFLDDMWACARHHAFRCAHLITRHPLDPADRKAAAAARDAWQELPMALRFAVDSAVRGRSRPTLVTSMFDRLRELEDNLAPVLAGHGYGEAGGYADDGARLPGRKEK